MSEDRNKKSSNTIMVKSGSDANVVAGSLTIALSEHGHAYMYAIGAAAVNEAIKAYIITKGQVLPLGIELISDPSFEVVKISGKEKTRIKFKIEPR